MRLKLLPLFAACGLLALGACHKPEPVKAGPAKARAVSVVTIQARPIAGAVSASGDLTPREEAAVMPEVNGYRVTRVLVDEGAWVRAGQTLAQLDSTLLQAQLAQAQAQADQADDQAKRVQGLDNLGVLSQEQVVQRRFQAQVARANLRDVQARMKKMAVVAPVSGLVLERTVRPGDLAGGAAAPWFRIAREGQVELSAKLSEDDLARIRPGQHATVTLPSGTVAEGVVRIVSPQIDPQNKLGEVRVLLPVRSDIRSGGFGRAVFADVSGSALAVPETAVRYDAAGVGVMVVGSDNRVRRAAVQTGRRGGGLVEIVRGPPAGTRVVQNAASFLLDGDLVQPTAPTAAPAAKAPAKAAR